jgi:hypothetical protein
MKLNKHNQGTYSSMLRELNTLRKQKKRMEILGNKEGRGNESLPKTRTTNQTKDKG